MIKTIKYCVRKNTQLTEHQEYVYCKDEETAKAVASRFAKDPKSVLKYKWITTTDDAKPHWCVTGDHRWVIAGSHEVRPGQWYIGIWDHLKYAEQVWLEILSGDTKVDNYSSYVGPAKSVGFVIVDANDHANPVETWCYRNQLEHGECFEYLVEPGQPYIAAAPTGTEQIPEGWLKSREATAIETKRWNAKVKRIPHWDNKRGPVVLPCINPLEDIKVNGMPWKEILFRYGEAQKNECIHTNDDGQKYVGRHDIALDVEQFAAAPLAWKHALLERGTAERAKERNRVVCDPVDEMPNMKDANGVA